MAIRAFPPSFGWLLESRLRHGLLSPAALVARLPLAPDFVVAEIGSGTGVYARAVRTRVARLIGVELQWGLIQQARAREPSLPQVQANAMALPFRPASFDLVYLVTVLGEVAGRERALREIWSVVRPGGFLAVAEHLPDPDFIPKGRLRSLCESAGFRFLKVDGPWWCYVATFQCPR